MPKSNKYAGIPTVFAGANTGSGFVSFYDSIFPEGQLDGLYIIKGGSGTGKSTFMRRLGDGAMKKGYTCEHYLCGSDETSLDGIIVNGRNGGRVGVIDGTPPHPREFRSPGAAGDILNFGMFWNSRGLRERRSEIDSIAREKAAYYDTAYRYLGAAERIDRHISSMADGIYLRDKGRAAAARLVQSVGAKGTPVYRQLMGYTMNGTVRLKPTSGELHEFAIAGNPDIARLFLADAEAFIRENGISAEISRDPLNLRHTDSIFFPGACVWLRIGDENQPEPEKLIHTRRFTDKDKAASCRQRIRFGRKCKGSLMEGAAESLACARELHFRLEDIYKEYMDFAALSSQSGEWVEEILARLDR